MLAALFLLLPAQDDLDRFVQIARAAVVAEVRGDRAAKGSGATPTQPVFVTIEVNGKVLGCRGSLQARAATLEEEVCLAARAAAGHDPRYRPLKTRDLDRMSVTVTVVDRLEPLSAISDLAPADGLVLRAGSKVGIVLPWEGKDPKIRLGWAYKKAGLPANSSATLERMIARRARG